MQNLLHDSFWYSCPFCYESTQRPMILLQNIGCSRNVFAHSCLRRSSTSLIITNRLSPFWKRVVPTKHCSTIYSRLTINFLNNFKYFCGIKTSFPAKTNHWTFLNCFFYYDLWYGQNRQVTSLRKFVPHGEQFELKVSMRGEESHDELPQVSWRLCHYYYVFVALSQNLPHWPCTIITLLMKITDCYIFDHGTKLCFTLYTKVFYGIRVH